MKRFWLSISSLIFALPTFALPVASTSPTPASIQLCFHPYMGVFAGYGNINNMLSNDGQSAIERLVIGFDSFSWQMVTLGAELGVQTGNTMRTATVPAPNEFTEPPLGTLPIQLTLKPVLDLLVSAKIYPSQRYPVYVIVKGGIAYRQMQVDDRDSIPSLHEVDGELQAGLGYDVNTHVRLSAFYQGIYSGSAGLTANSVTDTGSFSNIPTQQAGFVGFEYSA